jgi:putative transcriptional regulator
MAKKKLSQLDDGIAETAAFRPISETSLETADEMRRIGITEVETRRKITLRQLGKKALPNVKPIRAEEIRRVREREHISQAVLARYLNLTVGFIASLERGTKQPKGPALVLLNVIRRKGLEAIL